MVDSAVLCSPWATPDDIPSARRGLLTDAEWLVLLMVASEELWALSGEQWMGAGCSASAELSNRDAPGTGTWPYGGERCCWWPSGNGWNWDATPRNATLTPYAVLLPHTQVTAVTAVTIDGVAFAAWRLEANWLERTDGFGWDRCAGVVRVDYDYGRPPPAGGVRAAVELAVEMALADAEPGACKLPKATTSVSRQGMTITMPNRGEYLDKGRVGLPAVDRWLATVNPRGRLREAEVWSPDIPRMTSIP